MTVGMLLPKNVITNEEIHSLVNERVEVMITKLWRTLEIFKEGLDLKQTFVVLFSFTRTRDRDVRGWGMESIGRR